LRVILETLKQKILQINFLMKKKILIIGFGSIARKLFDYLKKNPNYEIGILRTFYKKKIKGCKYFFNIDDAVRFDAKHVFICSSADLHNNYFKYFNNKKNFLFIEKPLVFKANEIADYKKYKNNILVGYFLRFHPAIIFLKKYINKNIKKIRMVNFEVGYDVKKWRPSRKMETTVSVNKNRGGGALLELSHEIDLALWFLGDPDEIYCDKQKLRKINSNVEDTSKIILNYNKNKTLCSINLDFIQTKYSRSIKIILDNKIIFFDYLKNQILIQNNKKNIIMNFKKNLDDIYYRQINFFLNKFKKNEKTNLEAYANISSSIKLAKLIFLLFKSSKLKKKIKFK